MRIVLLGATGLVGHHLLLQLLTSGYYSHLDNSIMVLGRNKPSVPDALHNALNHQVDFIETDLVDKEETARLISNTQPNLHSDADILICCLGTTIKQAGSRQAFAHVDYDLVLSSAKAAYASGIKRMMFISAINAKSNSQLFYSRTKGQVEQALINLGFEQLSIIKPSLLIGQRKNRRMAESLSAPIMKLLNPLLRGRFKKYRAVEGEVVAECMVKQLKNPKQGVLEVYPTDYN